MVNEIQFYDSSILFGNSAGANTDKIAFHEDCCCGDIECALCSSTPPDQFQVDIAGVVDNACPDCEFFNDTWILTNTIRGGSCSAVGEGCFWWYKFPSATCTAVGIYLFIAQDATPVTPYYLGVVVTTLDADCGGIVFNFTKRSAAKFDCANLSGYDVPWDYTFTQCDASLATCAVTAL